MPDNNEESGQQPLRVLVVDDNSDIAEALGSLLELHGCEVRVAHSGEDGVEVAGEFQPGLIFMDLGLPGMSGYQAAREILEAQPKCPVKLVALTGYGESVVQRKVAAAGFDTYLLKPARLSQIQEILDKI